MRLAALVTIAAVALATTGTTRAANPSQELVRARSDFEKGDYKKVVETLTSAIALLGDEDQKEAHYLLGTAQFYLGHRDDARREFTALLFADPGRRLDPNIDSADVYAFFDALRQELNTQLDEIRKRKLQEQEMKSRPSKEIVIERTINIRSPATNFIPFGYGQFRNGDRGKGYFFLTSELITLGASTSLFSYQAIQYGFPTSHVPGSDLSAVNAFRVIQVSTGAAFLLLYGWSVLDGFSNQQPEVQETRTERPLAPTSRLLIFPTVSPDGVGAAAVWEF